MPIYLYWGDNDFALTQAVDKLRQSSLDPNWQSFNYNKIPPDYPNAIIEGLNQAMTPPFGMGGRFVWLVDTPICQNCSENVLAELGRTLPIIPPESILLLTSHHRPDGRLKSTKLLQKHAKIQEFPLIPPWKTEELVQQVKSYAQATGIKLTPLGAELLADAVGNNTRQLANELDKLSLYVGDTSITLDENAVAALVTTTTHNSLQLAGSILKGDTTKALGLIADLMNNNEPPLRIVATLIGQFRTWLWVKLMITQGETDINVIAKAAEVNNPKRIYFLKKEVQHLSLSQLMAMLPILLELDVSLKRGADQLSTLQTQVIKLCHICH